jgi:hypothetical protein
MRTVMHQDRKAKLARADDGDGDDVGDRIGPPRNQSDRTNDQRPGVRNECDALLGDALAHVGQLIIGQEIPGTHAKRGHGLTLSVRIA